jgi:hypothetical protein
MNGYLWFYAAHAHAIRGHEASRPVRQDHKPEPRTSRSATVFGLLLLLATIVTTYAALTA